MIPESLLRFFTEESRSLSCMSVVCGNADESLYAYNGVKDLDNNPVQFDSIYDLASLTKLFTGLLIMRLFEQNKLDLDAPITHYANQFSNLNQTTVRQVAWFQKRIGTNRRIDETSSRDEALDVLFSASPRENERITYSDIPAMTLKYVIEKASGKTFMDLLRHEILDPLGMKETFCRVPEDLRWRCVSTDREHRIEKGHYILREGVLPGIPHDPKARILYSDKEDCPGHAGLFSAAGDMTKLCQGILSGHVISSASLRMMVDNHASHLKGNDTYSQSLGCQCYVHHPDQHFSEVPTFMSDAAIGLSGFTGNHLAIDPKLGIFEFYLGSRVLNRITVIIPKDGESLADYGLNKDGTGEVTWPDGRKVISSVNFVYLKDEHLYPKIASILNEMRSPYSFAQLGYRNA